VSQEPTKKLIIFTDLDSTLLDYYTYSFKKALPALQVLKEKDIPLIICSSKTQAEIEYYRKKIDNCHPFISENGGGIFIPRGYFMFELQSPGLNINEENEYYVMRLGAEYSELRKAIEQLRAEGFPVRGFGDMTAPEIADIAHMSIDEAEMAGERYFDEPFLFHGTETEIGNLFLAIQSKGFKYTQGRFFHILGNSDKGKAVSIVMELYKNAFGEIVTIALGDSLNDMPMLERVDYPVIVQRLDGTYDPRIDIPNLVMAEGIGPEGWNRAVLSLIRKVDK